MLTKQKFFNVLRSKLVKKTKGLPGLLSDPLSQGFRFSKESGLIILGDLPILKKSGPFSRVTCPHTLIMVYFQGRSAHTYSRWSIFTGDLPTHTHTGLFSRATCPHIRWSIFTGDLPTHTHTGLLSRATCPHTLSLWSIFTGELPTHTHCGLFSGATCPHTHTGLFSRATCPHKLTLVYFHGRPALLIGLTWDPIWRSPLTRTKIGV
jgi:hypothetical protein